MRGTSPPTYYPVPCTLHPVWKNQSRTIGESAETQRRGGTITQATKLPPLFRCAMFGVACWFSTTTDHLCRRLTAHLFRVAV